MRRTTNPILVILITLVVTACQLVQGQKPLVSLPGFVSNYVEGTDWIVTCFKARRDITGNTPVAGNCRIEKYNRTAIVSVDNHGLRVMDPKSHSRSCDIAPHHFGVDGESLVGKSFLEKISALRRGKIFGREYQQSWPNCYILVEKTNLMNFSWAYEKFRATATNHGYKIPFPP